ncbi:MAG: 6-phosphofructokinase [Candidatus Eiseniibacteriota bacterium]|nr:MAG: 6-phosphofructokinase [Candidatus Eisenbacteria bacterium]
MSKKKRIAVLSGGGDCPGINAVIRAVTKRAILELGLEVVGVLDGYEGVIQNRFRRLTYDDVSGILTLGGTILGTSKTANPYRYPVRKKGKLDFVDASATALRNIKKLDIACLVCIGGDGTLGIASGLHDDGVPIVGVPKTIDNDIRGTEITFGFDSAVTIATDGIDRVHTTAQSHHRIMIVEVMGHRAGWIALHSGIAGGGDIILIPEIPYDVEQIARTVRERRKKGRRFSIVVVAEGAKPKGGEVTIRRVVEESSDPVRLGGIGFVLGEQLESATGVATRTVVMGHLQRGGPPTSFDRVLATQLGVAAVEMIKEKRFGKMVGVKGGSLVDVPLEVVAKGPRVVPRNHRLLSAARAVGTHLGD